MIPGGMASRMMSGSLRRGELRHQDQVNQNDRQDQSDTKADERLAHAIHRSAQGDSKILRDMSAGDYPINPVRQAAQVFT